MRLSRSILLAALYGTACLLSTFPTVFAEDYDDGGADADADADAAADADADADAGGGDDDAAADDFAGEDANAQRDDDDRVYDDDYAIKYWTEYAILPKRCIVYNNVDVIVFSVFEHGYKQCSDEPIGTYITPVGYFVDAYLNHIASQYADKGNDDWAAPDVAQYTQCQMYNNQYYVQLGCTDGTSQSLSVNIFSDNTCETRDVQDGFDDANIDVSDLQVPFKKCQACVSWIDVADDQVDDQYYENRQKNAPLCNGVWHTRQECDKKCQKMGMETTTREGWNTSDKILLTILSVFGCGMLIAILNKRQRMSNKDSLLEQAAMSAAGLQQSHVIGMFVLVVLVIVVFALLGLKNITWALMLATNAALFVYLMKLTVDSSVTGPIVGPDGKIIHHDESDDSSVESDAENNGSGSYEVPVIT
mmetsp:Transcript_28947/g.42664  ORF Transcript_28947/g.42664 Transcript_28947/m.42664 type:complete len:419 (+) Transcript_28947:138-1394(+)